MSVVTITVSDVDLDAGTYTTEFKVEDSLIDDGQMTAAAVTGLYVQHIQNTEEVRADMKRFGDDFVTAMKNMGVSEPTTQRAKAHIRIEDKDLKTGRIGYLLTFEGGAGEAGDKLPTPANIVGSYLYKLLHDMTFRTQVWEFAKTLVQENAETGATIGNPDESPITLTPNNHEAARYAA